MQQQLREAHDALQKKMADGSPPDQLAAAYGAIGNLFLAAEYFDVAERCYLNAEALAPREQRWPYFLGHVYRAKGEAGRAAMAFERALAAGSADVATLVWLGTALLDEGRAGDALPLFTRALSLESTSVAAFFGQGRAWLATRDYARAADALERALSLDPRASIVHYPLALAYRGLGETEKAEAELRQRGDREVGPTDPRMQEIGELLHSPASYEKRGLRALEGRDWAGAAAAFREAVRLAPGSAPLHHRLGTALSLAGDSMGAVEQFQEAIRRAPEYAPAHFSLGVLLVSFGRPDEAIERFASAVRFEPENADARLQLAAALIRARRFQEAHATLDVGRRLNPDRPEFARLLDQFRPVR